MAIHDPREPLTLTFTKESEEGLHDDKWFLAYTDTGWRIGVKVESGYDYLDKYIDYWTEEEINVIWWTYLPGLLEEQSK